MQQEEHPLLFLFSSIFLRLHFIHLKDSTFCSCEATQSYRGVAPSTSSSSNSRWSFSSSRVCFPIGRREAAAQGSIELSKVDQEEQQ